MQSMNNTSRDVFRVGLTPIAFPFWRLTLNLRLADPGARDFPKALAYKFSQLGRVKCRADAVLNIHIITDMGGTRNVDHVHRVARIMEALTPVVVRLTGKGIQITMDYTTSAGSTLDVSHMLGSCDSARWIHFINNEYAASLRRRSDTPPGQLGISAEIRA
jgi:hypothetical protein